MTSYFDSPNYTQVPNSVLDKLMSILSPAQFKCMMLIIRQTLGYHRRSAHISINCFIEKTGLSRQGIINAQNELEEMKLVSMTHFKDNKTATLFEIKIKNDEEDEDAKVVNSVDWGSQLSSVGVVNSVEQGSQLSRPLTPEAKERIKEKDKEIKNIAQSRAKHGHEQRSDFVFSSTSGKFEGITDEDLNDWKIAYPEIDIGKEIIKAEQWIRSNPSKAKKKLWRKFLVGWLARSNEKAENQKAYRSVSAGTTKRTNSNPCISQEAKDVYDSIQPEIYT